MPSIEFGRYIARMYVILYNRAIYSLKQALYSPKYTKRGAMSMENKILSGVHQAIGNTPMVHLSRLTENFDGNIFAKLEYLNPGFSKKDRIALQIIEEAEKVGILKPNDTVVELTSGNTGTGLAIVCGVKGYKFVAVMSKGNSMERARMMKALGAEVVLVDQAPGSPI